MLHTSPITPAVAPSSRASAEASPPMRAAAAGTPAGNAAVIATPAVRKAAADTTPVNAAVFASAAASNGVDSATPLPLSPSLMHGIATGNFPWLETSGRSAGDAVEEEKEQP